MISDSDRTVSDLDEWVISTKYTANNTDIQRNGIGYRCIKDHSSLIVNRPPDGNFWSVLDDPIPNTIKLVAKKIVRAIDKRQGDGSGFIRTIHGTRRFREGEQ